MIKIVLDEVNKDQNTRIEVLRCNSEGSGGLLQSMLRENEGWAALKTAPPEAVTHQNGSDGHAYK